MCSSQLSSASSNCHVTAVLRRSREDGNHSRISIASPIFYFSSPEIVLSESDELEHEHEREHKREHELEHCGTFGRDDIALIGTPATIYPRTS